MRERKKRAATDLRANAICKKYLDLINCAGIRKKAECEIQISRLSMRTKIFVVYIFGVFFFSFFTFASFTQYPLSVASFDSFDNDFV